MVINQLSNIFSSLTQKVAIIPLVTFRVIFGGLMLASTIRFWYNGWIEDFYITPTHFFSYFDLNWIQPYNETVIYGLFILMLLGALGILLGAFYRVSAVVFFLAFTYVELIDKTTYLNHYYFISLMAFLMIWMPAHKAYSVDSKLFPRIKSFEIPKWCILSLKLQILVVYFFAGVAKLSYSWLLEAQPMSLWLESKSHYPVIGSIFSEEVMAYMFSWAGMLFDLTIGFILFSKKFRPLGYVAVVIFHLATWWLFPIGVFPWVMIGFTLIFFSDKWHTKLWKFIMRIFRIEMKSSQNTLFHQPQPLFHIRNSRKHVKPLINYLTLAMFAVYFVVQTLVPLRHYTHEGDLYWTESGYRFSWRVMLMEKTGHVEFIVRDIATQKESIISNSDYFSPFQQRQMATQPDMIQQGAEIIASEFRKTGRNVAVYAHSFASLNGEKHKPLINPLVDLTAVQTHDVTSWIIPNEN